MRSDLLFTIIASFIGGVLVRSLFSVSVPAMLFVGLLGVSLLLVLFISSSKQRIFFLGALFLFIFSCGMIRFHLADPALSHFALSQVQNNHTTLSGMIVEDPDPREGSTKLTVRVNKIDEKVLEKKERILITTDPYTPYRYGDEITMTGTVGIPENFTSDLGKEFDYISYLKKDGIYFQMKDPEIQMTGENHGNVIRRSLSSLKITILGKLSRFIPQPESGLMSGILLGTKQSLGASWRDKFITTGTIHIIALSGYNVTIVAEWMMKVFGTVFAKSLSIWFGILGIVLFAIMTGAGSTVVRASIMAILVLVARMTGRTYDIGRALFLAGFVMILLNPWILVFDVSFQLSFLATVGLVYLSPKVQLWLQFLPKKWGIRELVSATLATNIFVLPFILAKMGIVSIISLPVNLLILPLMPLTMVLGIMLIFLSSVASFLGIALGAVSYGLLHTELFLIDVFSRVSFASISISHVPTLLVVGAYGLLSWYIFYPQKSLTKQ